MFHPPALVPKASVRLALATLFCSLLLLCLHAQAQDGGKLRDLFKSVIKPAAEQPAAGAPKGGVLGNLLGTGNPGSENSPPGGDLFQLLSQSVSKIDEPKEIEIGRQLAAVLLGSKPLHKDMALQRYVNQLGRWISLQSARPNLPWTFAVLDDDGFNAFATPGGYIFITKGLVDRVGSEAELAGILAHEITHVTSKHHLIALNKSARTGLVTQLIGSQVKGELRGVVSQQLLSLGRQVLARGLDKEDEFEADRNGVVLAARAGFDPYGLVGVLVQLRDATPENPLFTLTLSTHPAAQLRLDGLEQAMGNRMEKFTGQSSVSVIQRVNDK